LRSCAGPDSIHLVVTNEVAGGERDLLKGFGSCKKEVGLLQLKSSSGKEPAIWLRGADS
jgi:hypothetical protein